MRPRLPALAILGLAGSLVACSKPTADEHIRKADAYVGQSRLPEAMIEYRQALQIDPRRGDVRFKLADLYVRTRDGANALKEYVRAADLLPKDIEAQLRAGNVLLMAGAFEDAKTRANAVLTLDPKSIDGQILLGNALAQLKDMDGALTEYEEAVILNPAKEDAYLNIGAIQAVRGQADKAEATFKKAIEVAPKSTSARMALANFLWASGRVADAEQPLKDALALEPANLAINRALGVFYIATNRASEAEPYFKLIAQTAKTSDATLGLADYYAATRRFDDARQVLGGLASRDDTFAAATTRLAAIDIAQGSRAEAMAKVRAVLEKYPKDVSAALFNARLLLLDEKREEALSQARVVVTNAPDSPAAAEAYLLIGGVQLSLDHRDEAIKAYQEVLKLQPKPLNAALALSSLYLAGGELEKATTYAQQALVIRPGNPLARGLLVRILLAQGKVANAKDELATLQRDYEKSPTVWNLQASVQLAARQVEAARASYTQALRFSPRDLEANAGLAQLDLASGHTSEALKRVEDALKRTPLTGDFLMLAAQVYGASGNADKAEELLKKAIEIEPARLQAYGLLGAFYARQNLLIDAKGQFDQIARKNPTSIPANTMIAMLLEAQGKLPEAEQQYQKVLALDSQAAVAANNLAWIYATSNRNLDQALELAQVALRQLPDEPRVSDTLGWIYYQKNMAPAAIQHLESSVQKEANEPAIHYHLGMAYARDGQFEKAKKELQRALALNAEFEGAADARQMLSRIGS